MVLNLLPIDLDVDLGGGEFGIEGKQGDKDVLFTFDHVLHYVNQKNGGAPHVDVAKTFGLLGNTKQDKRNHLEDVIGTLSETHNGGKIILPPGRVLLGGQTPVILPTFMPGIGLGQRVSILSPYPRFSGEHLIQLGPQAATGVFAFDCYLQSVGIDLLGFECMGVRSYCGQEGTGLRDVLIGNCSNTAALFAGGKNANLKFDNVEFYNRPGSIAKRGLDLDSVGGKTTLSNVTSIGMTSPWTEAGVRINQSNVSVIGAHFEGTLSGLRIDGSDCDVFIVGVTGPGATSPKVQYLIDVTGKNRCTLSAIKKRSALFAYVNRVEKVFISKNYIANMLPTNVDGSACYLSNGVQLITGGGDPNLRNNRAGTLGEPGSVYLWPNPIAGQTFFVKETPTDQGIGWTPVTPRTGTQAFVWGTFKPNEKKSLKIRVPGASMGDAVLVGINIDLLGCELLIPRVTYSSIVTVEIINKTNAEIHLPLESKVSLKVFKT